MENHWEHRIAGAYKRKDANVLLENREQVWEKIAVQLGHTTGVASGWRVAAIGIALLAFGSVFGTVYTCRNNAKRIVGLQNKTDFLQQKLDSVFMLKPEIYTETVTIEKEKIVYRDRKPETKKELIVNQDTGLKKEIQTLKIQLQHSENKYIQVKDSLDGVQKKLDELVLLTREKSSEKTGEFELKPERVPEQMQPVKTGEIPKMKLQILKIQDDVKYETGSTLLKK